VIAERASSQQFLAAPQYLAAGDRPGLIPAP
jgi:hypothetical protein